MFVLILSPCEDTNHDAMSTLMQAICGDVFATHSDVKLLRVSFPSCNFFTKPYQTVPYRTVHKNLASASDNFVVRSSGAKKKQQDLTLIQKTNANEEKSLGWRNKPGKLATSETTWANTNKAWRWDSWIAELRRQAQRRRSQELKTRQVETATSSSETTWVCQSPMV